MSFGFSWNEYYRVRDWLIAAFEAAPTPFDEAEMLGNIRSGDWHLLTTENAACVLQLGEWEGERFANVLLIGGKKNGSLREIMQAYDVLCHVLQQAGYSYIVGQPRKEWHRFLLKYGFEQQEKDFIKRLH